MSKLVIFDCDGTLVDSEVIATKVFTSYWASHGVHITETEFKENFIGKGNLHPDNIDLFKKMPSYAMEEGDRLWAQELKETLEPVPGIRELVSSLDCNLSVGSNSNLKHVEWALEKTNLKKYFGENIFSAELVENPKPAPDLFLHIANNLGFGLGDCIIVEDSVSGVMAAKNAGIKVIGFTGASHFIPSLEANLKKTEPDELCTTVESLKSALASFL